MRSPSWLDQSTWAACQPTDVGRRGIAEQAELGEVATARERRPRTAEVDAQRGVEDGDGEGVDQSWHGGAR